MKYLLIISISAISSSQTVEYFQFERLKVNEIRQLEMSKGSKFLGIDEHGISTDYFKGATSSGKQRALSYISNYDDFEPKLRVNYYFSSADSVLYAVTYSWDIMNEVKNIFKDGHKFGEQFSRYNEYADKYGDIKSIILHAHGNPSTTNDSNDEKTAISHSKWQKDNRTIDLRFNFTHKATQQIKDIKLGTFRVRMKIYWQRLHIKSIRAENSKRVSIDYFNISGKKTKIYLKSNGEVELLGNIFLPRGEHSITLNLKKIEMIANQESELLFANEDKPIDKLSFIPIFE